MPSVPEPKVTFPPLLPPPCNFPIVSSYQARLKTAPVVFASSKVPKS
jgi:hypothetical protein